MGWHATLEFIQHVRILSGNMKNQEMEYGNSCEAQYKAGSPLFFVATLGSQVFNSSSEEEDRMMRPS